jgi:hypothetical protein
MPLMVVVLILSGQMGDTICGGCILGGGLHLTSHRPTSFNIFCIKSSRSMNAIIFIEPAHFGQIKGSVSYIF